ITGRLQPGANAIGIEVTNGGSSPSPAGLIGRMVIRFATGDPMVVPIDSSWQTSREAGERWAWTDYNASQWPAATEIAAWGDQPWGKIGGSVAPIDPAPLLRKTFAITQRVKRATLYASALGVYSLRLNGKPVDSDVLSPGWTDYKKRVHYFGYD